MSWNIGVGGETPFSSLPDTHDDLVLGLINTGHFITTQVAVRNDGAIALSFFFKGGLLNVFIADISTEILVFDTAVVVLADVVFLMGLSVLIATLFVDQEVGEFEATAVGKNAHEIRLEARGLFFHPFLLELASAVLKRDQLLVD